MNRIRIEQVMTHGSDNSKIIFASYTFQFVTRNFHVVYGRLRDQC
jgi:hypothetical protein